MNNQLKAVFLSTGVLGSVCSLGYADIEGVYNKTAMVDCQNSWDISFNADYIYWIWQQGSLQLGTLANPKDSSGFLGFVNSNQQSIYQTPSYASGFQVGLGVNFHGMDDWRLKADYTWYENVDHKRVITSSSEYFAVGQTILKTPRGVISGLLLSGDLLSVAKLDYDELDVTIQRLFYNARNLTGCYSMGLKALWINQYVSSNGTDLSFIGAGVPFTVPLRGSFQSSDAINSWALGPVFGFDASWLLGYGIRIEGDIHGALLYTSYTALKFALTGQVSDVGSADILWNQPNDYNTVSPVLETSMGLGWGSYLCNQNLYLDLYIGYDFNVYWNRTVIQAIRGNNGSAGNMYLQGLNVRLGIDY